jgi:hypothetical protein
MPASDPANSESANPLQIVERRYHVDDKPDASFFDLSIVDVTISDVVLGERGS